MPEGRRTVIITRPERAARRFADLIEPGIGDLARILVAPVLDIVPEPQGADLAGFGALIFTSENGVHALGDRPELRGRPAFCVGDRTSEAAAEVGYAAHSASGDVTDLETLLLRTLPPGPWLHVTGEHQRGDLAGRLTAAGHPTERAVAYRQDARPLSAEALDALRAGPVVLPVFSPRSGSLLCDALPTDAVAPDVVAISAAAARGWRAPARSITVAEAPDAASVAAAVLRVLKSDSHC